MHSASAQGLLRLGSQGPGFWKEVAGKSFPKKKKWSWKDEGADPACRKDPRRGRRSWRSGYWVEMNASERPRTSATNSQDW